MAAFAAARQQLRGRSCSVLRDVLRSEVGSLFGVSAAAAASKASSGPLWRSGMASSVHSWSSAMGHSVNWRVAFPSASGLDIARGFATRAGRVDIGARARQNQARRLWTIALSGTAVAGFVIVILNTFQENLMFYITPSQALEKFFLDPTKNRFRLGGLVLEGSVQHFKNSTEMEFVVTDLANEILVRYRGALPDLFREGHSVVAEGFVRPIDQYPGVSSSSGDQHASLTAKARETGCYFAAIEVLAKHDEKYMPKEVAAAVAKNKAMQEGQEVPALLATTPAPVAAVPPPPSGGGPKKKGVAQAPAVAQSYEINA
ncbi:hypothetical protein M758_2G042800 [Ceratodon purpureus]|nr:hypothetical protein M758_2G042800 [Ceratodon purpureus]